MWNAIERMGANRHERSELADSPDIDRVFDGSLPDGIEIVPIRLERRDKCRTRDEFERKFGNTAPSDNRWTRGFFALIARVAFGLCKRRRRQHAHGIAHAQCSSRNRIDAISPVARRQKQTRLRRIKSRRRYPRQSYSAQLTKPIRLGRVVGTPQKQEPIRRRIASRDKGRVNRTRLTRSFFRFTHNPSGQSTSQLGSMPRYDCKCANTHTKTSVSVRKKTAIYTTTPSGKPLCALL